MPDRPNILLVMADQLSAAALPAHGNPVVSAPHLDRLAAEGVVFEDPYCPSPLCAPSRAALLTGRLPSRTGVYDNAAELPASIPTVAHYLRAAGYQTSAIGKMHFVGPDQLHGFEERLTTDIYPADFGWTPDWENFEVRPDWWYHNMSSVVNAGPAEATNQLDFDDAVGFQAVRKLRDVARSNDERPFFLTVSFTHPHDPYVMRPEYLDRYELGDIPLPRSSPSFEEMDPHSRRLFHVSAMDQFEVDVDAIRAARRAYYASVSYVDDHVGKLLATMERCGLADDTVVVFTSDHGDLLGEHGLWFKMSFFDDSIRVPLIIRAPGRFEPGRVVGSVSLLDLLPTFAELAEIPSDEMLEPIDGRSLLPAMESGVSDATVVAEYMGEGAVAPVLMVRRGPWKLVTTSADPDQLFDLKADPGELDNLAESLDHADVLAELRAVVTAHWDEGEVHEAVLDSQRARRVVRSAHVEGSHTSWDHHPPTDAANQFMRNHLVLNDVESARRYPGPG